MLLIPFRLCFAGSKLPRFSCNGCRVHVMLLRVQVTACAFRPCHSDLWPGCLHPCEREGLAFTFIVQLPMLEECWEHCGSLPVNSNLTLSNESTRQQIGLVKHHCRRGQVLLATVNEQTIVPFVSTQLNNLDLALALARRGNLPGAEALVGQNFERLFASGQFKEAAEAAAESPQVGTHTLQCSIRGQADRQVRALSENGVRSVLRCPCMPSLKQHTCARSMHAGMQAMHLSYPYTQSCMAVTSTGCGQPDICRQDQLLRYQQHLQG